MVNVMLLSLSYYSLIIVLLKALQIKLGYLDVKLASSAGISLMTLALCINPLLSPLCHRKPNQVESREKETCAGG
jgi:hypothetical protein